MTKPEAINPLVAPKIDIDAIEEKAWRNMATNVAIPRLADIVENSDNDATVVKGIAIILDRALGKPTEHIDLKARFSYLPQETVEASIKALRVKKS